jgi:hypothetical protein
MEEEEEQPLLFAGAINNCETNRNAGRMLKKNGSFQCTKRANKAQQVAGSASTRLKETRIIKGICSYVSRPPQVSKRRCPKF